MAKVFLGCPLYDNWIRFGAASGALSLASREHTVHTQPVASSLIPATCNSLWCNALNLRESMRLEWFAMLHSDIEPQAWWLDALIAEAVKHGADILSAVVPIKNLSGGTSTAIGRGRGLEPFCRLMQAQVRHDAFPDTFDVSSAADALERLPNTLRVTDVPRRELLLNTGCMVCRLDRPWCEEIAFNDFHGKEKKDGKWRPVVASEDWEFSRSIAEHGGRVMATRLIRVQHWGTVSFDSHAVWGQARDVSGWDAAR